eukprot:357806-Chlamydomonas_euryale.AAC.7
MQYDMASRYSRIALRLASIACWQGHGPSVPHKCLPRQGTRLARSGRASQWRQWQRRRTVRGSAS